MQLFITPESVTAIKKFLNFTDINIVENGQTYYNEKRFQANFDAILYLDGGICHDKTIQNAIAAGIPIYGIPRIDKDNQTILLHKAGIKTPRTWFADSMSGCNDLVGLLFGIPDDYKLILKYSTGARGLGQVLATKRELIDLTDCESSDLDKLFNETVTNEYQVAEVQPTPVNKQLEKLKNIKINKHEQLRSAIYRGKDYIIQDYIPNRKEWRMLWFYKQSPIIVERSIDENGWQANACNNSPGSSKITDIDLYENYGIDINLINRFFSDMKTPFMSVDLYYDTDKKEWGIFEFQMEFGWTNTVGIDTNDLHQRIVNATKMMIYPTATLTF